MSTPRRSFLSRLAALLAVGSAPATLAAAVRPEPEPAPAFWPDERWLEMIANREHKIIIEAGSVADGLGLRRALNFIDVLNQDYQIPDGRVGCAVGTHSGALVFILNDAMWAKHGLGAKYGVKDAQGNAATTNTFRAGAPFTVEALAKRGVQFLACNRSLMRLGRELAGATGNANATHAELVANVLPGVVVTPAMIVAVSRAGTRGVPYMAVP